MHRSLKLQKTELSHIIRRMTEKGWIRLLPGEDGSRRKEYCLTAQGLYVLKNELDRLRELVENGESVLGGKEHG